MMLHKDGSDLTGMMGYKNCDAQRRSIWSAQTHASADRGACLVESYRGGISIDDGAEQGGTPASLPTVPYPTQLTEDSYSQLMSPEPSLLPEFDESNLFDHHGDWGSYNDGQECTRSDLVLDDPPMSVQDDLCRDLESEGRKRKAASIEGTDDGRGEPVDSSEWLAEDGGSSVDQRDGKRRVTTTTTSTALALRPSQRTGCVGTPVSEVSQKAPSRRKATAAHRGGPGRNLSAESVVALQETKQKKKMDDGPVRKAPGGTQKASQESSQIKDVSRAWSRHQSRSYLFTWSHSEDIDKAKPCDMGKEELSGIILTINRGKSLLYYSIFHERHKDGNMHAHFLMKYATPTRWKQLADTLRNVYRIFASVSCAVPKPGFKICMYPVLFSYCFRTNPDKPLIDLDLKPYLSERHPDPTALIVPRTRQEKAKRVRAMDRCDFQEFVVKNNIKTENEVLEYACRDKALNMLAMNLKTDIQALIDRSWQIAGAARRRVEESKSPMEKVKACLGAECSCASPGLWFEKVSEVVVRNLRQEGAERLREDIIRNLEEGRSKQTNVVIYGVASSGKTAILQPLTRILKCAATPDSGKFSLEDLLECECIFWNDFRLKSLGEACDMGKLLNLLEGGGIKISRPRNHKQNDSFFTKLVPIFITCNALPSPREEQDREPLIERLQRRHFFPYMIDHKEQAKA
ncbi:hypothetical protein Pmar_PMAR022755 [Perkinsus marinus ATCC 50983]|uniref:Uncharacterized protein n=1 Tax=Perkinsus marinus (strain ATCC 50983 / TXsc) TaxID=423536 RepID=C5LTH8_PERM5|nr:hypothetical protein Pmar_PMAR022755 [Perkinsus marinus ATCC 50983]EEQ99969.1 hypothetical protein Pmar_PMAR022755 [Perkinsus marinus ATCC 50983]|eukprot:XP_002767252.1 hypothetical protein Pmar_PMAR022755 [Perkinsus marinus ATCC 50983]